MGCGSSSSTGQNSLKGKTAKVLIVGLDGAGKTSILYKLVLEPDVKITTRPTAGFNVENVGPVEGISLNVWDVGGQERLRPLWRHYFTGTDGFIYVIDSQDRERLCEVREELGYITDQCEEQKVPLLILANKQDLPDVLTLEELTEQLPLTVNNNIQLNPSSIKDLEGLNKSALNLVKMIIAAKRFR